MIRLGLEYVFLGAHRESLLGTVSPRSRGFNYSKERRSPGWGRKIRLGPLYILALRRGAHRAGVGKIRLGAGVLIALRRGAHRAGVGKIRLGAVALITLRRGAHRAGVGKIRLGPLYILALRRALAGLGSGRSVSEQGF